MKVNRNNLIIYLVIAVALLTRLAYFFQYAGTPFYAVPMWDAGEYHDMAIALSKGSLHPSFAFRPPLYPILLGVVYMIFGVGPLVPSLLQIAGGVYACVLVQRIATRLFGEWAGLGAGLAAALSGMMVFFDLELMPTSLEVILMLLLLNELIGFADNKSKCESAKVRKCEGGGVLAGVWFALAVLARPVILPLLVPFLMWGWWVKAGWQKLTAFALVGLSSLLFMLLLNLSAGNGAMLTPAQGGVNFYIGNRPGADGFTATLPNVGSGWGWDTITKLAEKDEGRSLTPKEVDSYYWKLGRQAIASDPMGWLKLQMRKGQLIWNHLEISNDRDIYYHAHRYPIIGWLLWIGLPLFLPFAALCLWVFVDDRRVMLLTATFVFYSATVTLFFVNGRFRHPLTPVFLVLAAGGVKWIVERIRRKDFRFNRYNGGAVLYFLIGAVSPFIVDPGIDPKRWDYGYFTEATALEKMGQVDQAEVLYKKALEANPRAPFVNFNLGDIERSKSHLEKAAEYYYNELAIQPSYGKAWNNLGLMAQASGNNDRALECFEEAIRVRPDLAEAVINASTAWQKKGVEARKDGDDNLARQAFERAEELRKVTITPRR